MSSPHSAILRPESPSRRPGLSPLSQSAMTSLGRAHRRSFAARREYHRVHHPFAGTQRKATRIAARDRAGNVADSCPLGPYDRDIADDDGGERSPLLETKTADRGSATSERRCWRISRRAGGAGAGYQRFLLAGSCFTLPGDHRSGGRVPPSGDLPVEGTDGGW